MVHCIRFGLTIHGYPTLGFLSIGNSGPLRGRRKCLFPFSEGLLMTGTLNFLGFGDAFLGLFEIFWHWRAFDEHPLRIELALNARHLSIERALIEFTLEAHSLSIQVALIEHPRHWPRIWRALSTHLKSIQCASEEHPMCIWRASNMHQMTPLC